MASILERCTCLNGRTPNLGNGMYESLRATGTAGLPGRRGALGLVDAEGEERTRFAVGESLFVTGRGLRPCALYDFALEDGRDRTLLARYASDRHGSLA